MIPNINIIIPIGGVGNRFKNDGYQYPKPLINIMGEPMIFWLLKNLNIHEDDNLYIVYNSSMEQYNFIDTLKHNFDFNIQGISIDYSTRGASETVLIALNNMDAESLSRPTLILDCDNIYFEDIITKFRDTGQNKIFYFNTKSDLSTAYSFIKINENNEIIKIAEKQKISNNANCGAYGFDNGVNLKKNIMEVIDLNIKTNNEFYISNIYSKMLERNDKIIADEVKAHNSVGIPFLLKSFCINQIDKMPQKRICFDLDNTLVTYPAVKGDYTTVEPISRTIGYVKFLKKLGHTIIIQTARRMRTHNGDVEAVKKDIGKITEDTIKKYEIPCDELYYGKPYAHFYVDDLGVNTFQELDKSMGFYDIHPEPRSFNKIVSLSDNKIEKFSKNIESELHYYEHMPKEIEGLFPKLISSASNGNGDITSIIIEKIHGIPLSSIYSNCSLTYNNIDAVLSALQRIHNIQYTDKNHHLVCYNYIEKFNERIESESVNKQYYKNFNWYIEKIKEATLKYKTENKFKYTVIHGDPVFSNILINEHGQLKFIDMRGKIKDTLTTCGDMFYDYAKVYQSILGYDFILHGKNINHAYVQEMQKYFKHSFIKLFGPEQMSYLKYLTASLIISLLPLHEDMNKKIQYYNLIEYNHLLN